MTDETSKEVGGTEGKSERQLANIVRGVMPLPLVYLIRFEEPKDTKDADVAKKYGTTSGKVADIRKNRNFGYIDADFKPTQEQIDASIKWLKAVPGYDANGTDAVVTLVESMDKASDADVQALTAKRADVRAKNAATAGNEGASTGGNKGKGGGGRKGGGGKKEAAPTNTEAADLMS